MSRSDNLMALIFQAQAHDATALDRLLVLVRDRMKGFFHERVGPIESSDLAQDIILKVSQHLADFQGSAEAQFWGRVTSLARNRWVDEIRRQNRDKRAGMEVPLPRGSSGGVRLPG